MLHRAHQGLGGIRDQARKSLEKVCGRKHVSLYGRERDAYKLSGMGCRPPVPVGTWGFGAVAPVLIFSARQ